MYGKMIVPDGTAALPGLVFSSEADTNTGFFRDAAEKVGYAAAGSASLYFTTDGIEPATANTEALGAAGKYWFNIFSSRMQLLDGVTAPSSTPSGFATIYIDGADGDLKIRFSDGTVKTIVTDT
jgi:hypothetical protein